MLFTLHGGNFNLTHMQELGEQASWILSFLRDRQLAPLLICHGK